MTFSSKSSALLFLLVMLFVTVFDSDSNAGPTNGVVNVESGYSVEETVSRILADVKEKGITFFAEIDQSGLGTAAGVEGLKPSRLILFGNPALGTTFITANPQSGLDWPVRVLVYENGDGRVMVAYDDFDYIANRHSIKNRTEQFAMATTVIQSVLGSVKK
jgi:uncharacterized protein (DUF302 family)